MTESEWLASEDPQRMLATCLALTRPGEVGFTIPGQIGSLAYRPSERKLRLFAIAVARQGGCGNWASVGHLIRAAERMAEGQPHGLSQRDIDLAQPYIACWLVGAEALEVVQRILHYYEPYPEDRQTGPAQAALLRDIVGNPYRPLPVLYQLAKLDNSGWSGLKKIPTVSWLTATVYKLAQAAYDGIFFSRNLLDPVDLAVLADALEEAGCRITHPILAHLRSPDTHVRGCWALDLLLGKE